MVTPYPGKPRVMSSGDRARGHAPPPGPRRRRPGSSKPAQRRAQELRAKDTPLQRQLRKARRLRSRHGAMMQWEIWSGGEATLKPLPRQLCQLHRTFPTKDHLGAASIHESRGWPSKPSHQDQWTRPGVRGGRVRLLQGAGGAPAGQRGAEAEALALDVAKRQERSPAAAPSPAAASSPAAAPSSHSMQGTDWVVGTRRWRWGPGCSCGPSSRPRPTRLPRVAGTSGATSGAAALRWMQAADGPTRVHCPTSGKAEAGCCCLLWRRIAVPWRRAGGRPRRTSKP